jgi:hypothetical protein
MPETDKSISMNDMEFKESFRLFFAGASVDKD